MRVKIEMSGPQACGKTVLADKLMALMAKEAPPGTEIRIVEYTGPIGEPVTDRRYIRESEYRV